MKPASPETKPLHRTLCALPLAACAVALCAALGLTGCGEEKKEVISGEIDPEHFATMTTTDVSTLISDSGVIRYHITAPLWLVFDEASEPHWKFPQGLFLEKYNDSFKQDASITSDSAIYFRDSQLWRLDGYVEITNPAGEKFLTRQLFWDQRGQKVYSDSFIHIERADRIIEGYGFVSNDRMTKYEVLNVSGIFPSEQFKPGETSRTRNDTVQTDSIAKARRCAPPRTHTSPYSSDGTATVIIPSSPKERIADEAEKINPGQMKALKPANGLMYRRTDKRHSR